MPILPEPVKREIEEKVELEVLSNVDVENVSPEFLVHKTIEIYSNFLESVGIY